MFPCMGLGLALHIDAHAEDDDRGRGSYEACLAPRCGRRRARARGLRIDARKGVAIEPREDGAASGRLRGPPRRASRPRGGQGVAALPPLAEKVGASPWMQAPPARRRPSAR